MPRKPQNPRPPRQPRKPVTHQQLAANRANAARSTGPRTPQGKARSAQNACKHGFAGSTFAVVRFEELDEVTRLKQDLISVYQPVNSQEVLAIERMALAQQSIIRAARLESGLLTVYLDEAMDHRGHPFIPMSEDLIGDDIEIVRAQNRNFGVATGFERLVRRSNSWQLFLRYQAQAERHYRRALEEFERLVALRASLPPELPNEPISDAQPEQNQPPEPPETNPSESPAVDPPPPPAPGQHTAPPASAAPRRRAQNHTAPPPPVPDSPPPPPPSESVVN